jgi:hypothetical protein
MVAYARNTIDDGEPNQHIYVLSSHELLKLEKVMDGVEKTYLTSEQREWADKFQELFQLGVSPGNYEI